MGLSVIIAINERITSKLLINVGYLQWCHSASPKHTTLISSMPLAPMGMNRHKAYRTQRDNSRRSFILFIRYPPFLKNRKLRRHTVFMHYRIAIKLLSRVFNIMSPAVIR